MSFSRISVLAVFFMMVMSAFVTIPSYHVGAEEDDDNPGAYFVYIMTTERSEAITSALPFSLHFPAPPMSDNSPYELEQICDADGEVEGVYATWVTSSGGNAGDFNNITSWSVKNTNGIELEKFVYDPMSDIIDFEHPMVVFEDDEDSSGGHISAEVFDQDVFYCGGGGPYLNAFPTGSGGADEDYEMSLSDPSITLMATELTYNNSYRIMWEIYRMDLNSLDPVAHDDELSFVGGDEHFEYIIGGDVFDDDIFVAGCYQFWSQLIDEDASPNAVVVEVEHWPFTLDVTMDACMPDPDEGGECPFDADNPESPCNAQACEDHESSECYEYVNHYCEFDGAGDPGCHDGGDDNGDVEPEVFHATMTMESLEDWMVDFHGVMPVDWSDNVREDVSMICADIMGTDDGEITEDCIDWWIEEISSDGDGGEHHEDGCPPGLTDEQCNAFRDCEHSDAVLDCSRMRYDICVNDDYFDFCHEEDTDIINSIFEYEDGVKSADDFVDIWASLFGDFDDDSTDPALYDIQTFTIGEDDAGTYQLYKNFVSRSSPDFICGSGSVEAVPFYQVNNDEDDCEDGSDEQKYDDDGNEINWFDCHDGSEVWIHQVNDWHWDCADGEDENQDYWWYGELFLFSGILIESEEPEDTTNLITGVGHFCGWEDEYEVSFTCDNYAEVELSAGDYSILTTGPCYDEWIDEDEDGEDDSPGVIECNNFGEYNHSLKHVDSGEVVSFHSEIYAATPQMEMSNDYWASIDYRSNFVLYDTFELTVGSDGFDGAITSVQWECYDYDEDGEYDDCWGSDLTLYLYEYSFNPDVPRDNILGANDDSYDEHLDCPSPSDECSQSVIQVELSEGTYVVVTAGYSAYSENAYYLNHMVTRDGDIIETWDGELSPSYWEYDDNDTKTKVQGDDRTHIPSPHEFEGGDDFGWFEDVISALTSYQDGTMTASEAADSIVATIYEADEEGLLGGGGGDGHHHWESYDGGHCEWEGDADDQENAWYCKYSEEDEYWDTWWYYCEVYYDDDGSERWVCTDDFGQDSDYEFSAGNTHYKDDTSPYDDHYEHHDEDDNPALLDGIVGVTDPEDNDPMPMNENLIGSVSDNEGSPLLMGTSFKVHFNGADDSLDTHELSIPIGEDGEDWYVELSLLEGYEVISCDNCATLEIDGSEARFHANEPVTITFGMAESLPDCDVIVGVDADGMAFDKPSVEIEFGQTVCWQWEGATMDHNVAQVAESGDATMLSTGFYSGAPSDTVDYRVTFDEASGYSDDTSYYYICEPHATSGMVGEVVVGTGSTDEELETAIEESGRLPSVSFIAGVLVLVGAAGLRRRIH